MKKDDFNVKVFSNRFSTLLSQSEENTHTIAKKVGTNPSTISRYANGEMTPKLITLYAIADVFGVNPLWLMGLDEQKSKRELPDNAEQSAEDLAEINGMVSQISRLSDEERKIVDDLLAVLLAKHE